MDGEDTTWMEVFEKKGLHQEAGILENYGITCETDVSLLDRDDFFKLVLNVLKSMEGKKLERWCDTVRARDENMLTSSLNTTAGAELLSSEELNVLTLPVHSATVVEVDTSGGTEAPVKKDKITLTEEQEAFTRQFQSDESKIDKTRKITLRHVSGRGVSMKKHGARVL